MVTKDGIDIEDGDQVWVTTIGADGREVVERAIAHQDESWEGGGCVSFRTPSGSGTLSVAVSQAYASRFHAAESMSAREA